MDINIKRDLNETLLIMPAGTMNMVAYRILTEKETRHLMRPKMQEGSGNCAFAVPAGSNIRHRYASQSMDLTAVRRLFFDLNEAFSECRVCFLKPENIILRPQLILQKESGEFVFLAHPGQTDDLFGGLKRLVHFCCERFSGDGREKLLMDSLRRIAEGEFFRFEELLSLFAEEGEEQETVSAEKLPAQESGKKPSLLVPVCFLVLSAALLSAYALFGESADPKFLLGSFVCLASSAASAVLRIRNKKKDARSGTRDDRKEREESRAEYVRADAERRAGKDRRQILK